MNNVLVTGATGFVGSNLIIELIKLGYNVRSFRRPNSDIRTLQGLDIENIIGDILDTISLRSAIRGCDTVFHTAALVSFWKGNRDEQFEINVKGTRNVVDACCETGIEKLIHTSTIAALGYRTDEQPINETVTYNWGTEIAYRYTKHLAELEVLKGVEKGLNATIVNPSVIIGPRDIKTHGGRIIIDIKRGRIPAYTNGGANVVSVHDVVKGEIAAAKYGKTGERYILGGTNFNQKELLELVAKVIDGKAPSVKVPNWTVNIAVKVFDFYSKFTKTQPLLTSDLAVSILTNNWCSVEKVKKELGYQPTSIEEAIREAYEWYKENKMI